MLLKQCYIFTRKQTSLTVFRRKMIPEEVSTLSLDQLQLSHAVTTELNCISATTLHISKDFLIEKWKPFGNLIVIYHMTHERNGTVIAPILSSQQVLLKQLLGRQMPPDPISFLLRASRRWIRSQQSNI